jgi:hypothetical protein
MPYVGNLTTVRDKESCYKDYQVVQETSRYNSSFSSCLQNAWTALPAEDYVSQLLLEAPHAMSNVAGQLAVVTGVTAGSVALHVAQELALQAGMHVVLLARSASQLRRCAADIRAEALQRGLGSDIPITLYGCKFHLASLDAVKEAADYVTSLAQEKYHGKVHILANLASVGSPQARLTMDNSMEYNTGCNFVATHCFTQLLITLLQKAAIPGQYKPRVIFTASMGHALGTNFHPHRLVQYPKEGGAPPGYIVVVDDNTIRENYNEPPTALVEQPTIEDDTSSSPIDEQDASAASAAAAMSISSMARRLYQMTKVAIDRQKALAAEAAATRAAVATGAGTQVGRSKMALVANAVYWAHLYPEINFTSHHPGSIVSTAPSPVSSTFVDKIYNQGILAYTTGRLLSPNQGARAALRAALDPDFDRNDLPDLQHGAYLHADGNPWTPAFAPSSGVLNPKTQQPYTSMLEFGQACHEAAGALMAQIISSKQEQQEQIANVATTTTTATAATTMTPSSSSSSSPLSAAAVNVNHGEDDVQLLKETSSTTCATAAAAGKSNAIVQ